MVNDWLGGWGTHAGAFALAVLIFAAPASHADDGNVRLEARGLKPFSLGTIPPVAKSLLPKVVTGMAARERATRSVATLQRALSNASIRGLEAMYPTPSAWVLTGTSGLTNVGKVALRWLDGARFHGFDALDKRVKVLSGTRYPAPPPAPVDWRQVDVSDASLVAAWREAGTSQTPLLRAGESLSKNSASLQAAAQRYVEEVAGQSASQADREIQLLTLLTEWVLNVRARPRTEAILMDTVDYLSPDTLWRNSRWSKPALAEAKALYDVAQRGAKALEGYLADQLPGGKQYTGLIAAAKRYETMCAGDPWPKVVVRKERKSWRWRRSDNMRTLQQRLAAEGFYTGEHTASYDDATRAALKAYQRQRHLKPSGAYTRATSLSLNVSCNTRLATILLNIKRWRHTALEGQDFYIYVNLPAFRAEYVVDGKLHTDRRVVVGSGRSYWSAREKRRIYKNRTPILTDTMSSVILNPTWTVPRRIILNELQPKIDKDPDYLEKNGYISKGPEGGRQVIVQLPGDLNALGNVKFYFPNPENIYMHDTPRKGLFNYPMRDASHGCIRLHEALDFARVLLREDYGFRDVRFPGGLKSLVRKKKTMTLKLHRRVPVIFEYYTASIDPKGGLTFHPDIYDYDYLELVGPLKRGHRRLP